MIVGRHRGWTVPGKLDKTNIAFRAGTGGLHSAEN